MASLQQLGARLCAVVLTAWLCGNAYATPVLPMRFEALSVEQGLAQNSVIAIEQDSRGFLWFGTENGLDRFDGYRFTHFSDSQSALNYIPADYIHDLETDADGTLWVATDGGGLLRWSDTDGEFEPIEIKDITDGRVGRLAADPRGYLWVGSRQHGLFRVDIHSGDVMAFTHSANDLASLSDNQIRALWLDGDGTLWVGTNGGLNRLESGATNFDYFKYDKNDESSISNNLIRAIHRDSSGQLWVGTGAGGLNRFDAKTETFVRLSADVDDPATLSSNRVEALLEDHENRLWVATSGGLNLLHREELTVTRFDSANYNATGLSDENTISLFQDRTNIVWVGTRSGGVNKWNPRTWSFGHYRPSGDDPRQRGITALAEAQHGGVWFGTLGGGLVELDQERRVLATYRKRSKGAGLSDNRVMALTRGGPDELWVGTMGGGLNRIDTATGNVEAFKHDPDDRQSIAANGVMSLHRDSQGTVWVGTYGGGIDQLDPTTNTFIHHRHDPDDSRTLSGMRATAVIEDSFGQIWVGTEKQGLNRLRVGGAAWERISLAKFGANEGLDSIYSLHSDATGKIWVGTRAGLARLDNVNGALDALDVQFFTEASGLPDDNIYGIQSDRDGQLWLSSGRGLSVMAGDGAEIRNYFASHGLQGTEFNFGAHTAGADGKLYFGGANGFNVFDPAGIKSNATAPEIALVGLLISGKYVNPNGLYENIDVLNLSYTDNHVTFEFAALDFAAPERNRYAYKLDGFDDDWVESGREHRTTYTNLPAGNFRFLVRAANSDGVWAESGIDLALSVEPPPWKSPWAYALYVIAFVSAGLGIWHGQQNKLRLREEYSETLENEVRQRTGELNERNRELYRANEKLHNASYTDMLTGLKNRRYFFEEIGTAIDQMEWPGGIDRRADTDQGEYVFLMVDLDHFKPVNDTYGHVAGDQMLVQVAEALRSACRSRDTVIRWGGDEFLVVARRAGAEEATLLAERVRSAIASCVFSLGNGKVARTSSSIGLAAYPFFDHEPRMVGWEQVLKIADLAMYVSKEHRNAWTGITGIDYHLSADSLLEELHADLMAVHSAGNIIVTESVRHDTGRVSNGVI